MGSIMIFNLFKSAQVQKEKLLLEIQNILKSHDDSITVRVKRGMLSYNNPEDLEKILWEKRNKVIKFLRDKLKIKFSPFPDTDQEINDLLNYVFNNLDDYSKFASYSNPVELVLPSKSESVKSELNGIENFQDIVRFILSRVRKITKKEAETIASLAMIEISPKLTKENEDQFYSKIVVPSSLFIEHRRELGDMSTITSLQELKEKVEKFKIKRTENLDEDLFKDQTLPTLLSSELIDNSRYDLYLITNLYGCYLLGRGTCWCFRIPSYEEDNDDHDINDDIETAEHYLESGRLFVINKNEKPFLAIHMMSEQVMDIHNEPYGKDNLKKNFANFYKKYIEPISVEYARERKELPELLNRGGLTKESGEIYTSTLKEMFEEFDEEKNKKIQTNLDDEIEKIKSLSVLIKNKSIEPDKDTYKYFNLIVSRAFSLLKREIEKHKYWMKKAKDADMIDENGKFVPKKLYLVGKGYQRKDVPKDNSGTSITFFSEKLFLKLKENDFRICNICKILDDIFIGIDKEKQSGLVNKIINKIILSRNMIDDFKSNNINSILEIDFIILNILKEKSLSKNQVDLVISSILNEEGMVGNILEKGIIKEDSDTFKKLLSKAIDFKDYNALLFRRSFSENGEWNSLPSIITPQNNIEVWRSLIKNCLDNSSDYRILGRRSNEVNFDGISKEEVLEIIKRDVSEKFVHVDNKNYFISKQERYVPKRFRDVRSATSLFSWYVNGFISKEELTEIILNPSEWGVTMSGIKSFLIDLEEEYSYFGSLKDFQVENGGNSTYEKFGELYFSLSNCYMYGPNVVRDFLSDLTGEEERWNKYIEFLKENESFEKESIETLENNLLIRREKEHPEYQREWSPYGFDNSEQFPTFVLKDQKKKEKNRWTFEEKAFREQEKRKKEFEDKLQKLRPRLPSDKIEELEEYDIIENEIPENEILGPGDPWYQELIPERRSFNLKNLRIKKSQINSDMVPNQELIAAARKRASGLGIDKHLIENLIGIYLFQIENFNKEMDMIEKEKVKGLVDVCEYGIKMYLNGTFLNDVHDYILNGIRETRDNVSYLT